MLARRPLGIHDRAALGVESAGPIRLHKGSPGDELTGNAIQHPEEAVLRCLHDDLSGFTIGRPLASSPLAQFVFTKGAPEMNSPVMRSSTQKKPFFDACVITFRGLPLIVRSSSINCCTLSKSQLSLGVVWKCHLSWPVVRSTARIEHVYKLSTPCAPRNFCTQGSALPVPT